MADGLLLVEDAAAKLVPLLDEVVFVGGAVLPLLVTDKGAAPVRGTLDVDVVSAITTYGEYAVFAERIRALGFTEDTRAGAPLCRWVHTGLTLDVMPLAPGVLGFSNRWYRAALDTAQPCALASGTAIRLITAPLFLATKIEAFRGRGQRDFYASHDLEDFIAVVEGRPLLIEELAKAPRDVRAFLAAAGDELLGEARFLDAVPGYLPPDPISQSRVALVLETLRALSRMGAGAG